MNRDSDIKVIGLTGPTGSGKTTVSEVFAKSGYYIINADKVSRDVIDNTSSCIKELAEEFTDAILNTDGTLNRKKLGEMVFNDKAKLIHLGSIVYPYITARILKTLNTLEKDGVRMVLLDAPTLFESNADDFCSLVVCVNADVNKRLNYIIKRDNLTEDQALSRIKSQPEFSYYAKRSDFILQNDSDIQTLESMASEVAKKIWEYYNAKIT